MDFPVELIHATVQLEQPLANGTRTVGTGFILNAPDASGQPRTVLVTANHVLDGMPGAEMRIGYRFQDDNGVWRYRPQEIKIRDQGRALWVNNPGRDVAAMVIQAPETFAKAAIPLAWLADGDAFNRHQVGPGHEMMALGFPKGVAANGAGFPILRAGKVASYPLGPSAEFPTFLLDFSVFPGNSGGPVFISQPSSPGGPVKLITGMLTQQIELNNERLEIGMVTQATFIRETIALLDRRSGPIQPMASTPVSAQDMRAFSASSPAVQVSK